MRAPCASRCHFQIPMPEETPPPALTTRAEPRPWVKALWLVGGWACLALGLLGVFLPLLPTVPFVLLAATCFARGSKRWEGWLLGHPRWGPYVRSWRQTHAVPLRAKQWAWATMTASSAWAWFVMPKWPWLPAVVCGAVAVWLWRLPTLRPGASDRTP